MTPAVPTNAVVVFDVDDTLYLERDYVRSGFDAVGQYLAERFGLASAGDQLWAGFCAGVRRDAFDRVLTANGLAPTSELVAELVAIYRNHEPTIALAGDAVQLIEWLIDWLAPRAMAIITDGPASSQWAKVKALELEQVVDHVVVTADLGPGHHKPDPLPYLAIEERFQTEPRRCWYIGDNPAKDFVTPQARGWTSIRIRRPDSLHAGQPTPDGVAEIGRLTELIDANPTDHSPVG